MNGFCNKSYDRTPIIAVYRCDIFYSIFYCDSEGGRVAPNYAALAQKHVHDPATVTSRPIHGSRRSHLPSQPLHLLTFSSAKNK